MHTFLTLENIKDKVIYYLDYSSALMKVAYLKSSGSKPKILQAKRLTSLSQLQQTYNSRHLKRTPNLTTRCALDWRNASTEKQQENFDYKLTPFTNTFLNGLYDCG